MAADEEHLEKQRARRSAVYKCGYLAVSSKGLGWKTWKRRWFLLTRTSLLYFKTEPKGSINGALAMGGIDLNSSVSLTARGDKKQVTLSYQDGRAFTLRVEDLDDYEEWKVALEKALAVAPSAVFVGQSLFFGQDLMDASGDGENAVPQARPLRSLVLGRPILLALEDIDGSPSFLEKAIRFIEMHGVRQEGILRESADVAAVERRILEYEQGEKEFNEIENPHVIGDCVKHVLREMPSPIVPYACCTALEQCVGLEEELRSEAVKMVLEEAIPEPNRRLLQRLLKMMLTVAEFEKINRMNKRAVATCMGPLILRPLMIMDTQEQSPVEGGNMGGRRGGSVGDEGAQIIAAARSAARVQSLIVFLMDNFGQLFPTRQLGSLVRTISLLSYNSIPSLKGDNSEPDSPTAGELGEKEGDMEDEAATKLKNVVDSFGSFSFPDDDSSANGRGNESIPVKLVQSVSAGGSHNSPPRDGTSSHWRHHSLPPGMVGDGTIFSGSTKGHRTDLRLDTGGSPEPSIPDEEAQLRVLELSRQDLKTSLSREIRATTALRESLYTKKSNLITKRINLQKDVAALRIQLEAQKEMLSEGDKGDKTGSIPTPKLDSRVIAELEEIGGVEKDIVKLKSELGHLRRQLAFMQHRQQTPSGMLAANQGSTLERREKVQNLLELKSQLHRELERTMVLCLEEQQKNTDLEGKQKNDSPTSLEKSVMQQRTSLVEAQAALQAELQRGKELRKMIQTAQKTRVAVDESTSKRESGSSDGSQKGRGHSSAVDKSFQDLTARLEQFRERRALLMQQLTQLSVESVSRTSSSVNTPREGN